jgi:hypothetical protein
MHRFAHSLRWPLLLGVAAAVISWLVNAAADGSGGNWQLWPVDEAALWRRGAIALLLLTLPLLLLKQRLRLAATSARARSAGQGRPPPPRCPALRGEVVGEVPGGITGCGIANAVRLHEVNGVRLSTGAVVDCPTARAFGSRPATGGPRSLAAVARRGVLRGTGSTRTALDGSASLGLH